jgi:hypothetical protein
MRKGIHLSPALFPVFFLISSMGVAQVHPYIPPIVHNGNGVYSDYPCGKSVIAENPGPLPGQNNPVPSDASTMVTTYDVQTIASIGNQRLYYWPSDNTMAACAVWSSDTNNFNYPGRGTGYNFFDGTQWGPQPSARLESVRAGKPSLQPYGINGECVLSYKYDAWSSGVGPLIFLRRANKGTGTWTETFVPNPPGEPGMFNPRMVTNKIFVTGIEQTCVHVIALTPDYYNNGTPYQGMYSALLYTRSLDGGETWEDWRQLPGLTTAEYLTFNSDTYAWANPSGNLLCFVVCNSLMDAFIMKSTDNGSNWTKTIIYNSPYNLTGTSVGSPSFFYCPGGSCDVAMDKTGMAHITFVLECDSIASGDEFWHQRRANGVVYWNESMPALRQDLDPDSLFINHQLIGWITDTAVLNPSNWPGPGGYYGPITNSPSMAIDDQNNLFVIWTSPTMFKDPSDRMLTHIFERTANIYPGHGVYWHDSINDLCTGANTFKECVYPSLSPTTSAEKFHILFQCDDYTGSWVIGMPITCYFYQVFPTHNDMVVMSVLKSDVGVGVGNIKPDAPMLSVRDNFPNPCHGSTTIVATTKKPGNLSLEITNIIGQNIYSEDKGFTPSGSYQFRIDAGRFRPGIYFYTVRLDSRSITKKMVVD